MDWFETQARGVAEDAWRRYDESAQDRRDADTMGAAGNDLPPLADRPRVDRPSRDPSASIPTPVGTG